MKILVIGSGAREHALVWKLAQSPRVTGIFTAPGNAGATRLSQNLNIKADDIPAIIDAATTHKIDLVVVGPEAPLAGGIVDRFQEIGIPIFGPTQRAAEIESSKVFAKDLMQRYGIPCAHSESFDRPEEAREYIRKQTPPLVVKADGLAAGKGVGVAQSIPEALDFLSQVMADRVFGEAGDRVIVEEFLHGREMSTFAFSDGKTVVPMVAACDYKPIYEGNKGPNTGGMGSYSPPHFATPELYRQAYEQILQPTVAAMAREGRPYQGVLYGGRMINDAGPKTLEFNARFGDPETQIVLPRLKTDLVDIMLAVIEGRLDQIQVEWHDEVAVGVVIASGGYPGKYQTGLPISGLDTVSDDVIVFHAGTRLEGNEVVTSGGRVLSVVATGKTLSEARAKVYENIPRISFAGSYYRKDIALV